jgi:phytoene/squalene synthetase
LNRREPDLERLSSIECPDRFGWAILPHVARSFAVSVVWLPKAAAHAARVAYLYARMLDTYEDMVPDAGQRIAGLRWFAARFTTGDLAEPAPPVAIFAANPAEAVHRLLVERYELVDRLFLGLPEPDRHRVAGMVTAMATSMERWGETFRDQQGVLETTDQLTRYCDDVIGEPARFITALMLEQPLSEPQSRQITEVAEFIQLANVTRDIERDLGRGVAYHRSLRPFLFRAEEGADAVAGARAEMLVRALRRSPAYVDLLTAAPLPMISVGRASAVVMLLFTDRYYRSCAVRAGLEPWSGVKSTFSILWFGLVALFSRSWTGRCAHRVQRRMLDAAETFEKAGITGA